MADNWWESSPIVEKPKVIAPSASSGSAAGGGKVSSPPEGSHSSASSTTISVPDGHYVGKDPSFVDKLSRWGKRALADEWENTKRDARKLDDLVRVTANAMTFGVADRVAGYMDGTGVEAERARTQQAKDRHGADALAAEIGGSMLPVGGLMKAASAAFSTVGRSMMTGGALGAADVAGHGGDQMDMLFGAATGAAGGALGSALSEGGKMVGRLFRPATPASKAIKAEADALFKQADEAGVVVSNESWRRGIESVHKAAKAADIDERLHTKAITALDELDKLATAQPTLKEVEKQRRYLVDLIGGTSKEDKPTIRVLTQMKAAYDDWLNSLKKPDLIAGDADGGVKYLVDARKTWTKASKMEILEDAFHSAELAASPFDQAIRGQMRNIAKRKDFKTRWTVPEQRAIEGVAQGGTIDNLMSNLGLLGKIAGVAGTGLSAGLATGGPIGAVAGAMGGYAAQKASSMVAKGAADDLHYLVRTGDEYLPMKRAATLGSLLGTSGGLAAGKEATKKKSVISNRRAVGS